MQFIERDALRAAECLMKDIRSHSELSSSHYKKVFNRINEASQILGSKGIYPLMLWLKSQTKGNTDGNADKIIVKCLEKHCKQILESQNPLVKGTENKLKIDYNLSVFQAKNYPLNLEETIFLKKWLEKILYFALYKARALSKNYGSE